MSVPPEVDRPEWDAVRALLPPLAGTDVVDLGCGTGSFARWAAEQGAASVLGLEISPGLLDAGRAATADPRVHLEQSDLEQVTLRFASYDLAHAALVLDELEDPLRLARVVNAGLRPGGRFVATFGQPGRHRVGPVVTAVARARLVVRALVEWPTDEPALWLLSAEKPTLPALPPATTRS